MNSDLNKILKQYPRNYYASKKPKYDLFLQYQE